MDKKGELTGDDIAYIYPDMRMALKVKEKEERHLIVASREDLRLFKNMKKESLIEKGQQTSDCCTQGRFENGELVRGQICELIGCYEVPTIFLQWSNLI